MQRILSLARHLQPQSRKQGTLTSVATSASYFIQEPPDAVEATVSEVPTVLPISYQVCTMRHRSFEDRGVTVRYVPQRDVPDPAAPAPRPPSQSWLEMTYPFSTSSFLREQYRRFQTDRIRLGLILEDVDSFAADVALRHIGHFSAAPVTAYADKINWFKSGPVNLNNDLRLVGQVAWVGKSSIEVLMEAHTLQRDPPGWSFVGTACFVMVAREPRMQRSVAVNPLAPASPLERELFAAGEHNREVRRVRRERSLKLQPPTPQETAMLHELLRGKPMHGGGQYKRMGDAVLKSVHLMHLQDRNMNYFIFGGHLLREAVEVSYATAALHAGEACEPVSMEDVAFLQPVPIGCILQFTSQVVYVEGPIIRVGVRAERLDADGGGTVTNDFNLTYVRSGGDAVKVFPETIQEAWRYIEGHRQHMQDADQLRHLTAA